jgi:hypothetical protein
MTDLSVASHRFDCPLANHGGICTCPPGYSQVLGPVKRTEVRLGDIKCVDPDCPNKREGLSHAHWA